MPIGSVVWPYATSGLVKAAGRPGLAWMSLLRG
jgi:hypothetical protein